MSGNKKKLVETVDEDDSSSETSSDSEGGYNGNEEVQIDFEGRSPVDSDFHGISQLLSRLFLKAKISCSDMANLIISQNYVGSVIYQCPDDEDSDIDDMYEDCTVFGITTAINLTTKQTEPCIQQLLAYIIGRAEKNATDSVLTHFRDALSKQDKHVGFLINERFINIPPQISVPLLQNLKKEFAEANLKNMNFNFVYFIMIIKLYRKAAAKGKPSEEIYTNPEDEVICGYAVNSFEYSVADECEQAIVGDLLETDSTLTPYRKVILFDGNQLPVIIEDIEKAINGM